MKVIAVGNFQPHISGCPLAFEIPDWICESWQKFNLVNWWPFQNSSNSSFQNVHGPSIICNLSCGIAFGLSHLNRNSHMSGKQNRHFVCWNFVSFCWDVWISPRLLPLTGFTNTEGSRAFWKLKFGKTKIFLMSKKKNPIMLYISLQIKQEISKARKAATKMQS